MSLLQTSPDTLTFSGLLTKATATGLLRDITAIPAPQEIRTIDLSAVEQIDSAGVALLDETMARIIATGGKADLSGASEEVANAFRTFSSLSLPTQSKPHPPGFFETIGDAGVTAWHSFVECLYLTSDIFYWAIRDLFSRRGHRKGSFIVQGVQIGVEALGIIGLLSFILGLILGLQSAAQLRQFGANIYMADLLTISLVREMGPIITAVLLAGRSGSSIASEIATMKVTEELDALRMMAINPIRYVVVPKFLAVTVCMPVLVTMSIILGILGGLIIAVGYLDLTAIAYLNECVRVLVPMDLIVGIGKSVFFAWVIVIIGSFYGFRVEGGAEGVGKATTASVVASIFAVIILDALFSLFYLV